VKQDVETFEYYLTKSEIISTSSNNGLSKYGQGTPLLILTIGLISIIALAGYLVYKSSFSNTFGRIMVISFFLLISIVFYVAYNIWQVTHPLILIQLINNCLFLYWFENYRSYLN
jgi:hypothetical protein